MTLETMSFLVPKKTILKNYGILGNKFCCSGLISTAVTMFLPLKSPWLLQLNILPVPAFPALFFSVPVNSCKLFLLQQLMLALDGIYLSVPCAGKVVSVH